MSASSALRLMKLMVMSAIAVTAALLLSIVNNSSVMAQTCSTDTNPGNEAPASPLNLQMPFRAGETWTVGGLGSFYGNSWHCNDQYDYYATDWNRPNDEGAIVLAAADGVVSQVVFNCSIQLLGCFVQIDHAGGFRTVYGHLIQPAASIVVGAKVKAGTVIGTVGTTGNSQFAHLHLSFKHGESAGYLSYCASSCDRFDSPRTPQGYKPSPMMTASGSITLTDGGSYMSVNGRVYLPNLRESDVWQSAVYVRNMSASASTRITLTLRSTASSIPCGGSINLGADQAAKILVDFYYCGGMTTTDGSGFVDSDQVVAVNVLNEKTWPYAIKGAYTGVPATALWPPGNIPLVAKRLNTASGLADSEILIQNTSSGSTTAIVSLIGAPGYGTYNTSLPIAGYNSVRYRLSADSVIPTGWYGSAVVSADGAGGLAVASDYFAWDMHTDFASAAYPPTSKTTDAFIPSFMVRRTTQTGAVVSTPLVVQNLSGNGITLQPHDLVLTCKAAPLSGYSDFNAYNTSPINDNATYSFNPVTDTGSFPVTGWYGSCRLQTNNPAKQFIVMAQIRYPANQKAAAYEAIRAGGTDYQAFFPTIKKRVTAGEAGTVATSVFVQNLGNSPATAYFYYASHCPGFNNIPGFTETIPVGQSVNHNHRLQSTLAQQMPDGWCGSLRVVANQPIDGFAQVTTLEEPSGDGDTIMAYNAMTHP